MGITLYCREAGEGELLVLLHGNGEDGGYFEKQIEYFRKTYRVIAVDTRGHGRSPRGNRPFTLEQFADDLKNFLDKRGLKKMNKMKLMKRIIAIVLLLLMVFSVCGTLIFYLVAA